LTAGKNALTSVPDLSLLTGLTVIDLNSNRIAQPIISSFAAFTKLRLLDLHGNLYTGSLSASAFDSLLYLTSVDLGFNKLEGSLPDFYMNGTAGSITAINLQYNLFSGTVPLRWRFLQNLVSCSLAHNSLISPVQPFVLIFSLQTLDLSFNNLTLTSIDSAGRQLVGNLGPFLRFSVPHEINSILLNNNRLSGVFSPGWATFQKIAVISVANNQLSGQLPVDLWTDFNAAKTIQRFDLSGNLWVAPLPPGAPPNCLLEIDLSNCPLLANALTSIPSFLQASSELILDRSATFSCPRLINRDIAGFYKFFVDPVCLHCRECLNYCVNRRLIHNFSLLCVFLDLVSASPSTNMPRAPVNAASPRAVRRPTACNFRRKLPLAAVQTRACLVMAPRLGVCARVSTLSGPFRRRKAPSVLSLSFSPCFRPKMDPTTRFPCFRAARFQRILCSSPPATCLLKQIS
jgi:hypothetical protein